MGGAVPWQSSTYILINDVEESATVCRVEEVAIGSEVESSSYFVRHSFLCVNAGIATEISCHLYIFIDR